MLKVLTYLPVYVKRKFLTVYVKGSYLMLKVPTLCRVKVPT